MTGASDIRIPFRPFFHQEYVFPFISIVSFLLFIIAPKNLNSSVSIIPVLLVSTPAPIISTFFSQLYIKLRFLFSPMYIPSSAYIKRPFGGLNNSSAIVASRGDILRPCGKPLRMIHLYNLLFPFIVFLIVPISISSLSGSIDLKVYSTPHNVLLINSASSVLRVDNIIYIHDGFILLKNDWKSNS